MSTRSVKPFTSNLIETPGFAASNAALISSYAFKTASDPPLTLCTHRVVGSAAADAGAEAAASVAGALALDELLVLDPHAARASATIPIAGAANQCVRR